MRFMSYFAAVTMLISALADGPGALNTVQTVASSIAAELVSEMHQNPENTCPIFY